MKVSQLCLYTILCTGFVITGCDEGALHQSSVDPESASVGTMPAKAGSKAKLKIGAGASSSFENLASATITVREVQIRSSSGKFLTFLEQDFDLDLIQLASGIGPILARAQVPVGEYDLIRLITYANGTAVTNDGRQVSLSVPSGPQTGIKVFLNPSLVVQYGVISSVSLSFDLSRSFVETQGGNHYLFKPVVKAEMLSYEDKNPDGDTEELPGDSDGEGEGSDDTGSGSDEGTGDESGDGDDDGSGGGGGPGGGGGTIPYPEIY